MTPRQFLLATRNSHKVREIAGLLAGLGIELSSLDDLGIGELAGEEDVEVFSSFERNALAKARFYRRHTGIAVIADDSGLCVDALRGAPGVRSRRFAADHDMDRADQDEANNDCLLHLLDEVREEDRGAHYRCAIACVEADRTLVVAGRVHGRITRQRRGTGGFGYDPLFLPASYDGTFGELSPDVKARISHRAEAIRSLREMVGSHRNPGGIVMAARKKACAHAVVSLALLLASSGILRAQDAAAPADPADVESIDAIIGAVYDVISGPAGAERDWDRMRSLFLPDARLIPSFPSQGGGYEVRFMSLEDWIGNATGWFAENPFFEVEISRVEERYGHIAHAFSTYESRREAEGEPFTRGINSFQLLYDGSRWWIVNIYWQGETESEPIPTGYLP